MTSLLLDIRLAFRLLAKAPVFTMTVLLTLAIGIGANASVFHLMEQSLNRPLPFSHSESLAVAFQTHIGDRNPIGNWSVLNFRDFRERTRTFSGVSAITHAIMNLNTGDRSSVLRVGRVSTNFFQVLQVQPILGRTFAPEEELDGAHHVVILQYSAWQNLFGGSPDIIGRGIRLDGQEWTIIGVLPKEFSFTYEIGKTDAFYPLAFTEKEKDPSSRGDTFVSVIGRLYPGVTAVNASHELAQIMTGLAKIYPNYCKELSGKVISLHRGLLGEDGESRLILLFTLSGLVLIIGCINIANLILARNISRRQALAIRAAIGATRRHLLQLLMVEGALLAVVGGVLGLFTLSLLSAGISHLIHLPTYTTAGPSLNTLLWMFVLAMATGLLFSAFPAWQATKGNIVDALHEESKASASAGTFRARQYLVVAEVGLSTALLVVSSLMIFNLYRLRYQPLGFESRNLLVGSVHLPKATYSTETKKLAILYPLVQRLDNTPGVASSAATDALPLVGSYSISNYTVEGEPNLAPGYQNKAIRHRITPGYFRTLRIPILEGRDFAWQEGTNSCAISLTLARKHFKDRSAIGRSIHLGGGPWMDVVAVVGDTIQDLPGEAWMPQIYLPYSVFPSSSLQLVVQAKGEPQTIQTVFSAASMAQDPDLPMVWVKRMDELNALALGTGQTQGALLAVFGVISMALALFGVFGLANYVARGRRLELGIRVAFGATEKDIVRLLIGQGLKWIITGLGLGVIGSILLVVALGLQTPFSIPGIAVCAGIVGFLGLVGLIACILPARSVARGDLWASLRAE